MNTKQIEISSVNHISETFNLNDNISALITSNDKTAITDGELRFHSPDKTREVDNFEFSIQIQAKGKLLKSADFPKTLKYNIKKNQLKAFYKLNGIIYFVVLVTKSKKRMYYRILGPTDIEQELNQIGEKNSKQIELEYFPMIPEEQNAILILARNKCRKHNILTEEILKDTEAFHISSNNPIDLTHPGNVSSRSINGQSIEAQLENGLTIPISARIEFWPQNFLPQRHPSVFRSGIVTIDDAHCRIIDDTNFEIALTPSLQIIIHRGLEEGTLNLSPADTFDEALTSLNFVCNWHENQFLEIDQVQTKWKINPPNLVDLKQLRKTFHDFSKLFTLLEVDASLIRIQDFEENTRQLSDIYHYFILKQDLIREHDKLAAHTLKLGPWQLLFYSLKDYDRGKNMLKSFGNLDGQQLWWVPKDDPQNACRVTPFEMYSPNQLSQILNLGLNNIIKTYENHTDDHSRFSLANTTVLKLITAADLQPVRNQELLSGALNLSNFIREDVSMSDIAQINVWQISKRLGTLSDDNYNDIRRFQDNIGPDNDQWQQLKAAASILLDNRDDVSYYLRSLPEDDRKAFQDSPIFKLHSDPEILDAHAEVQNPASIKWQKYREKILNSR
ncbi:hypothetical protein [Corynebacterium pseudodiphtheriticum]|uniref:hypothetical protein n=1 Tax=Corynebacterium pseudodiphtheriticum TaxID=37637 RepID=UPI0025437ED7|nr:hypothetical protein [Corynebacterium pseudodiphtheriticum]MDK4318324.1 hypothetical protein [Corynebacterium pseudodiphtheriticum]